MSTYPNPQPTYHPPPKPASRALRIVVYIVLGCVAFFVLLVVAGVMLFRSAQPHTLNTIPLTPLHLDARLTITPSYVSVDYHLETRYQPGHESDITDALDETRDMPYHFVLHLQASDGHDLCAVTPTLDIVKDFNGHSVGVGADGVFPNCGTSDARHASRWTLDYDTPRGARVPAARPAPLTGGPVKLPFPNGTVAYTNVLGTDYLTGRLFLSNPTTTLSAVNDADLGAIRAINAGVRSPAILNCQAGTCILLDTRDSISLPVIAVANEPVPASHGTFHPGAFGVPRPGPSSK